MKYWMPGLVRIAETSRIIRINYESDLEDLRSSVGSQDISIASLVY